MKETSGFLDTGDGRLAWRAVEGEGPTVLWLGGFASDMTGNKAEALAAWAQRQGRSFLRFDYFGHGASDGTFREGTISRWRLDALHIIDQITEGQVVLVGSSMGAWIASLVALSRPERIAAMVLIAPAPDFTEKLIKPQLPSHAVLQIAHEGEWTPPSPYDRNGYPITRALIEDGERWLIMDMPVPIHCPVHILQGAADRDVPWRHALDFALAIEYDEVVFTLIKDGDHRLSRDQDLARLTSVVESLLDRLKAKIGP